MLSARLIKIEEEARLIRREEEIWEQIEDPSSDEEYEELNS